VAREQYNLTVLTRILTNPETVYDFQLYVHIQRAWLLDVRPL